MHLPYLFLVFLNDDFIYWRNEAIQPFVKKDHPQFLNQPWTKLTCTLLVLYFLLSFILY